METQSTKQKADNALQQRKIAKLEKDEEALKSRNETLETENKELNAHNKAHLEFVKSAVNEGGLATQLSTTQEDNAELRAALAQKEQEAKTLQAENKPESEKTKEIKNLKTQVSALEDVVTKLKGNEKDLTCKLRVSSADHDREKELNTFLMRSSNRTQTLEILEPVKPSESGETRTNTVEVKRKEPSTNNDLSDSRNIRKAKFCFHEFHSKGSCPFKTKCLFSHNVSNEDRENQDLVEKIQRIKEEKSKTAKHNKKVNGEQQQQQLLPLQQAPQLNQPPQQKRNISHNEQPTISHTQNICETAFINGPGTCRSTQCSKIHNLDFVRIRKGLCHHHVLGECKRKETCWFTHEIPQSIKNKGDTVKQAKDFVQKSTERRKPLDSKSRDAIPEIPPIRDNHQSDSTAYYYQQIPNQNYTPENQQVWQGNVNPLPYGYGTTTPPIVEQFNHEAPSQQTTQNERIQQIPNQNYTPENQQAWLGNVNPLPYGYGTTNPPIVEQFNHEAPSKQTTQNERIQYNQYNPNNKFQEQLHFQDPFLFLVKNVIQAQIQKVLTNTQLYQPAM